MKIVMASSVGQPAPPDLSSSPEGLERFADSRGLPASFLAKYGVHVAGEDEEKPGWIAIPYPHLSGVWYQRYRNTTSYGPKYWAAPGTRSHLYNPLHLGPHSKEVWMAEGEFDALTLIWLGIPALGVPGAQNFHRTWKLLFEHARVVVAFDNDDAGRAASTKLVNHFDKGYEFILPDEYNDLNEWLRETNDQAVQDDINDWRAGNGFEV